jgi:CRISP-associated protein Cas1
VLLLDRSYSTLLLSEIAADPAIWLPGRATLGIGLPRPIAARCDLGSLDPDNTRMRDLIEQSVLPPRGSRIVVASADLPTVALVAGLENRLRGGLHEPSVEALASALERSAHPCRVLKGVDPSGLSDDATELVVGSLCRTVDIPATPLRYRVDVCREYLHHGDFTGRRTAVARMRRWLGSAKVSPRTQESSSRLMARIVSDAEIHRAWERVRDNSFASETAPKEVLRFEAELARNLGRIQEALRGGTWRPSTPRRVRIPKDDGSLRTLHIPSVGDRIVERAIASVVSAEVDDRLSPWSFAFRPGRGVIDALRALVGLREDGCTHVARFDIADAFSSLDHGRLMDAFERFVSDDWTESLVSRIIARDLPGIDRSQRLVGIAQGSPLSPLLCNLLLDELDGALLRMGLPAVRYADDIALAARSAVEAAESLRAAEDLCAGLGLSINSAKTTISSFADVVEFLGEPISANSPPADPGADDAPPRRRTLYLTSRTVSVHLRKGQVRAVGRDGNIVTSVPVSGVSRIVVMGPMGVSAGLRSHALMHGIDVVFLSRAGSWLGRYDSGRGGDVGIRVRQYRILDENHERLRIGRGFVRGKIANQRALLQRYMRRHRAPAIAGAIDELERSLVALTAAASRSALMGHEGHAAKVYLAAFGLLLPSSAGFSGRNRRPPRDPGNAALSFGYTLLTGEAHAACEAAGLDASVGILHDVARRRPSLALDLVEEFRPVIVDATVLSLFRRRQLVEKHFRAGDGEAVLLNDAGRKVLVDAYETRMLTRVHSPARAQRITYRDTLHDQARLLGEVIAGRHRDYEPIGWR